jgi:putative oxidoreductase
VQQTRYTSPCKGEVDRPSEAMGDRVGVSQPTRPFLLTPTRLALLADLPLAGGGMEFAGRIARLSCLGVARGGSAPPHSHRMLDHSTPLIFPQLGNLYVTLFPWAELALRVVVGLALVPHGLRNTFGMFPKSGVRSHNLTELAQQLDEDGYRPGRWWAPAISVTQLVCGPMLALGLLTRAVALPIVIFLIVSNYERWRVGGYFWNKTGLEYTLMWSVAAFYFLLGGGGALSLDHLLIGREL